MGGCGLCSSVGKGGTYTETICSITKPSRLLNCVPFYPSHKWVYTAWVQPMSWDNNLLVLMVAVPLGGNMSESLYHGITKVYIHGYSPIAAGFHANYHTLTTICFGVIEHHKSSMHDV